jgi:hypothetical protein
MAVNIYSRLKSIMCWNHRFGVFFNTPLSLTQNTLDKNFHLLCCVLNEIVSESGASEIPPRVNVQRIAQKFETFISVGFLVI